MAKTTHTVAGTSDVVTSRHGVSYFCTITGTASARVEMLINGEWKPATAAITTSTATVVTLAVDRGDAVKWRWNVTSVTGGDSVVAYLE